MKFIRIKSVWFKPKKKRKIWIYSIVVIIILIALTGFNCVYSTHTDVDDGYIDDIYESTYNEIDDLDLSKLEELMKDLDVDVVGSGDLEKTIKDIVDGKFDVDANNLFSYILKILTANLKSIIPVCVLILIIAVVIRILSSFSPNIFKDGILDIINFVSIGIVVIILGNYILSVNNLVSGTVNSMQTIINVIFPILLTLMGAIGATSSVAIYTPITTILNTTVSTIITKFLYPLYLFSFALIIISVISKRVKVDKLINFVSTLFKTSLSFVFTIFSGIFMIKGISAGKYDSVSIYTTKFAVKNYIPLIGSYISEGFNYIMLSSVLVKNALGLAGIILILIVVLSPVIYLLVLKLVLNLTSSLVELVGNSTVSSVLDKVAKITAYPIAIILGVAFMFIMSLSLLMCTANLI